MKTVNIGLILTITIVSMLGLQQMAYAQQQGEGFFDGVRAGKADGRTAALNDDSSGWSCSTGHSDSYCLGYSSGYTAEFGVTKLLH